MKRRFAALATAFQRRRYGASVAVLMFTTAAASGSGFFRELVIANFFGASASSDAIAVVVFLYDLVCGLFYQGALANAVVPLMARYSVRDDVESERDLVVGVGVWLAGAGVIIGAGLVAFGDVAARALFAGRGGASVEALTTGLRVGALGLVCASLASFLASALQAQHRYNAFPVGRMAWNASAVVLALAVPARARLFAILAGLSVGGVIQLGVAIRATPRELWRWRLGSLRSAPVREVARGSVPAFLGLGAATMALGLGERALLARLAPGSVAIASFAQRTATLLSTVGLAFLTVSFTEMALEHGRENRDNVVGALRRTVRGGVFALAPLVGVAVVLAQPIVSVLFGRGAFSAADVVVTSGALRIYGLTLIPGFVVGILVRALFAVGRPWSAVGVTAAITLVALGCDVGLLGPLGVFAIPLGYAVGLTVSCVVGVVLLRRILRVRIGWPLLRELRAVPVAMVTAALLLLVIPPVRSLVHGLGVPGKGSDMVIVVAGGLLYGAVYVAMSTMLRLPEVAILRSWLGSSRRAPSPEQ